MSPPSRKLRLLSPILATLLLAVLSGCALQSAPNPGTLPSAGTSGLSLVIICTLPGTEPRRILVPDGRSATDFCPASDITDRFRHATPGVIYALPAPVDAATLPPTKASGQPP